MPLFEFLPSNATIMLQNDSESELLQREVQRHEREDKQTDANPYSYAINYIVATRVQWTACSTLLRKMEPIDLHLNRVYFVFHLIL